MLPRSYQATLRSRRFSCGTHDFQTPRNLFSMEVDNHDEYPTIGALDSGSTMASSRSPDRNDVAAALERI